MTHLETVKPIAKRFTVVTVVIEIYPPGRHIPEPPISSKETSVCGKNAYIARLS